jgi:cytosine deaminase
MFDLIVRNATLPDGRAGLDIGIRDGRIAAIERAIAGEAGRTIDAQGCLVTPPFVDIHFHMDATLSLGIPRLNQSGTLLEGIALWGELKPLLTPEAVAERALRYCDLAVSQGLLAIRSHVDICDDRLTAVDALLEVKRQIAPYIDLQLVAFPQDGYFRSTNAAKNLERALDKGVDVVGGIPHFERTMEDGARRSKCCATSRPSAACWSTCIATRPTIRCRATSRRSPPKRNGSACRAASPARISPRCTAWTTTTSRSCCR